jgi:hypothetical protein
MFYEVFNIKQIVYHFHLQTLQILKILSMILTVFLQINTVKYDVDHEIKINYEKCWQAQSQIFTLLQIFVYIKVFGLSLFGCDLFDK